MEYIRRTSKLEDCHSNSISSVIVLSSDTFVTASRDKSIKIWTNNICMKTLLLHHATVLSLCAISSQRFTSAGADGMVNIISTQGQCLTSWTAHDEWIWKVVVVNTQLFTCCENGEIKLWCEANEAAYELSCSYKHTAPITAMNVDVYGVVYAGDFLGQVLQLNNELIVTKRWQGHNGTIRTLSLCNDKDMLLSGGEDNMVRIWKDEAVVREYSHRNFVQDIVVAPDSQVVISVSYDGSIIMNDWFIHHLSNI